MDIRIRRAETDEDLAAIARIVNEAVPDEPTSVEIMRWADRTYPGGARFLAELRDDVVGAASTGRIFIYPPDFDAFWASLAVSWSARRRGMGTALLRAVATYARDAGKTALHILVWEDRPDGIAFLRDRGFEVRERRRKARLDVAKVAEPMGAPPPGIEITTLAERPDLVEGVHAVATEGFADIPADGDRSPGSLDEFRARHVERSTIPADGFMIAVDSEGGRVVGYVSLEHATPDATLAEHSMVAVARAWRGRGIGLALERAVISWAVRHGIDQLEIDPHDDNPSMQSIIARLGYRDIPGVLIMRGSIAAILADGA